MSGTTFTHPYTCRAFLHRTYRSLSETIQLDSSRALERPLNHRSPTSIRGDKSTRYTRSPGPRRRPSIDAPRVNIIVDAHTRTHVPHSSGRSHVRPIERITAGCQDVYATRATTKHTPHSFSPTRRAFISIAFDCLVPCSFVYFLCCYIIQAWRGCHTQSDTLSHHIVYLFRK